MRVEVDLSGKVHRSNKPTTLALANGKRYSIRIAAAQKRKVIAEVRRRRSEMNRTRLYVLVFATLLYLLLKDQINQLSLIVVDV